MSFFPGRKLLSKHGAHDYELLSLPLNKTKLQQSCVDYY